ncbi:MAG: GTP-binding protein HflX [Rhodothermales bacterium]
MIDLIERPEGDIRAMLVATRTTDQHADEAQELLDELAELTATFGAIVIDQEVIRLAKPQSRYRIGSGNAERIVESCREQEINIIIFDDDLTPSQQRNWEKLAEMQVVDRHEIILEIFGSRASTREATLQIELAQTEYALPRLRRLWTHLHRQQGGIGGRGVGEKQLELDARMLQRKIRTLKQEIKEVQQHREEQRKKRRQLPVPNAAIVGYTNAGKSSLLNYVTNAEVFVEDKLFATLDPTTRRLKLPNNQVLLLTDTVGFIRKLPHDLVDSFKSTLEEAALADFLLHVVDVTNPHAQEHIRTTNEVLAEIGAAEQHQVMVFNKIDLVTEPYIISRFKRQYPGAFFISVHSGEGLDELEAEMADILADKMTTLSLRIPQTRYDVVANLHRDCNIISETYEDDCVLVEAIIPLTIIHEFHAFSV